MGFDLIGRHIAYAVSGARVVGYGIGSLPHRVQRHRRIIRVTGPGCVCHCTARGSRPALEGVSCARGCIAAQRQRRSMGFDLIGRHIAYCIGGIGVVGDGVGFQLPYRVQRQITVVIVRVTRLICRSCRTCRCCPSGEVVIVARGLGCGDRHGVPVILGLRRRRTGSAIGVVGDAVFCLDKLPDLVCLTVITILRNIGSILRVAVMSIQRSAVGHVPEGVPGSAGENGPLLGFAAIGR